MIEKDIKVIFMRIDDQFKTSLYKKASNLLEIWYNSNFLNAIRRKIEPAVVKLRYKLRLKDNFSLKLHLGCGNKHLKDYINIDFRKTKATDLVCDIRKLPYSDNSVQIIEAYHLIGHLPRNDLPKILKEWHRVLIPGGKLVIQCPDFDKAVKEYINGNEKRLDSIFGLQRFPGDAHLFGYNFKRLKQLLEETYFININEKEPQDYHSKDEPCLRVECIKGDNS